MATNTSTRIATTTGTATTGPPAPAPRRATGAMGFGATLVMGLAAVTAVGCGPSRGTAEGPEDGKASPGETAGGTPASARSTWTPVAYDQAFRDRWYDGEGELASYALTYPRYGELHPGSTAVAITVAEHLDLETRVKPEADPSAGVSAIKLNLAEDFQTGIYDYHLMTSAWVAVEGALGQPRGAPLKVAFSSQEWCGMSFHLGQFLEAAVDQTVHSYFEGEGDHERRLDRPANAFPEDALFLWARGLGGPKVARGDAIEIPLLRSFAVSRLLHAKADFDRATLRRAAETETVDVPAGTFEVEVATVAVNASGEAQRTYGRGAASDPVQERTWTFWVEAGGDRRVVRYSRDDGLDARLIASIRAPYWRLNQRADEARLSELGLEPRPPRTP